MLSQWQLVKNTGFSGLLNVFVQDPGDTVKNGQIFLHFPAVEHCPNDFGIDLVPVEKTSEMVIGHLWRYHTLSYSHWLCRFFREIGGRAFRAVHYQINNQPNLFPNRSGIDGMFDS